jgi:hypothetical protein
MRKVVLLFALLCSLSIKAQFAAGFGCGDPDAWFDKEIYFYCQNQARNGYGYGLNLSNISLIINGNLQIDVSGVWEYGDFIIIDKANGIEFEKGSTVALYVNGYYQGGWTCSTSNPSAWDVAKRIYNNKPRGRSNLNLKGALKILRKFKK